MATSYKREKNIERRRLADNHQRVTVSNGAGATTNYYPLDPSSYTSIIVTHHASDTPTIDLTNTLDSNDDLEHANVLWGEVYDGASTPYLGVQETGFTGVKLTTNPSNGDVELSITQFRKH